MRKATAANAAEMRNVSASTVTVMRVKPSTNCVK